MRPMVMRMWTYILRNHEQLRRIYARSRPDVG